MMINNKIKALGGLCPQWPLFPRLILTDKECSEICLWNCSLKKTKITFTIYQTSAITVLKNIWNIAVFDRNQNKRKKTRPIM